MELHYRSDPCRGTAGLSGGPDLETSDGYYVCTTAQQPPNPAVTAFLQWIIEEAKGGADLGMSSGNAMHSE